MPEPDDGGVRPPRLKRLAARVAATGIAGTLRKAFSDHVFRRSESVVVEFRRGWRGTARSGVLPEGIRMATVRSAAELPPLCDWLAWRHAAFARMLDDGKIGIFTLKHDRAVGCAWLSLADHRDPASREHYRVAPSEAYHYCWLVDPALRRSTLALSLAREVMVVLAEMGVERQFGVVDLVNRASYMIQYRFGYRECGQKILHYSLFGTRWTRQARYSGTLGPVGERRHEPRR